MLDGFGLKQVPGHLTGGKLKPDLRDLAGLLVAEVLEQMVLMEADFSGAIFLEAPLGVTTAGLPVGDVALSDRDAEFTKGVDNSAGGAVIAQHATNHVAVLFGQACDFAETNAAGGLSAKG